MSKQLSDLRVELSTCKHTLDSKTSTITELNKRINTLSEELRSVKNRASKDSFPDMKLYVKREEYDKIVKQLSSYQFHRPGCQSVNGFPRPIMMH